MRTIRIIEHISLDGVIQGPGGPEEDPTNGFAHGGWAFPHHDVPGGEAIDNAKGAALTCCSGARPMIPSLGIGRISPAPWRTA